MRVLVRVVPAICVLLAGCHAPSDVVSTPSDDEVAREVIALVRDGLDRLRTGDPRGITDACAEEVTYYSVEFDSLLVGRSALVDMYGPVTGETYYDHFEMVNPTVQVLGNVAVLAFDFASYSTPDDSQLRARWRSTQVLKRVGVSWRIVHIHWTLLESRLG